MIKPALCALLAAFVLTGCSLFEPDPPPVGTFEVELTGDVRATASGTAVVAPPDSAYNPILEVFEEEIPVRFETTSGRSTVSLYVYESFQSASTFPEIPEGDFAISFSDYDPTVPYIGVVVQTPERYISSFEGTVTFRRVEGGALWGTVEARYSEPRLGGPTFRGHLSLRFTAPDPARNAPAALADAHHQRGAGLR